MHKYTFLTNILFVSFLHGQKVCPESGNNAILWYEYFQKHLVITNYFQESLKTDWIEVEHTEGPAELPLSKAVKVGNALYLSGEVYNLFDSLG